MAAVDTLSVAQQAVLRHLIENDVEFIVVGSYGVRTYVPSRVPTSVFLLALSKPPRTLQITVDDVSWSGARKSQ